MTQLYTALIVAETMDPDVFLALWGSGCVITVFAAVSGGAFLRSYATDTPAARPIQPAPAPAPQPRPLGRHALGNPDRSQAGIPAAVLLEQIRAARTDVIASHKTGAR